MDIEEIRKYCLDFPEATEKVQWEDDLCFKMRGKIFAIVALAAVPVKVCFKCEPETFAELIERERIAPAPYVGRFKWVLVDGLEVLRREELEHFIRRSYEMVAAKAPKGKTPKRGKGLAGRARRNSRRGSRKK